MYGDGIIIQVTAVVHPGVHAAAWCFLGRSPGCQGEKGTPIPRPASATAPLGSRVGMPTSPDETIGSAEMTQTRTPRPAQICITLYGGFDRHSDTPAG